MTDVEFAVHVLGRRFGCDFRVIAIGPGATAILEMRGDRFTISLAELRTLVESGLVMEWMLPGGGGEP